MSNYNKIIIMGNLVRDPELRFSPSGVAVLNITVATNRTTKKDNNEYTESCYLDCVAFGKQAELIGEQFQKGTPIFLTGRLKTESWDDKTTGKQRSKIVMMIEELTFLPSGTSFVPNKEGSRNITPKFSGPVSTTHTFSPDDDVPF